MAYNLIYANQGSIRNKPLLPNITKIYQQAAEKAGIDAVRVVSGGQDASGPHRTGSHRHDLGGAGDVELLVGGRALNFTNKDDLPRITAFLQAARGGGLGGIGAGSDYMGNTTFHVGGGTPFIWGKGGRTKNAPGWLLQALGGVPTGSAGTTLTTAPVGAAAPAAPGTAAPTMQEALEKMTGGFGGTAPAEEGPVQSMGAPIPGSVGGGGEDLSSGAAALFTQLLNSRRKRYGLSLMGQM